MIKTLHKFNKREHSFAQVYKIWYDLELRFPSYYKLEADTHFYYINFNTSYKHPKVSGKFHSTVETGKF